MITVQMGRLEEAETEGVLRTVRSDFTGITAASRRVDAAAGEKIRARLDGMGELPVGGAVVTPGGDLRAPFIIHAVVESPEESLSAFGVQRALVNGLRRAQEWEMASLSVPPLGLGAGSSEHGRGAAAQPRARGRAAQGDHDRGGIRVRRRSVPTAAGRGAGLIGETTLRKLVGILIVATWLAMVGWQVRREHLASELTRLAEAALALAPGVSFYTLRMGERTVGQASSRLDTVPDGFLVEDIMSLELPALGQTGTAVARTTVRLSPALVMQSFDFSLDSEVGRFLAQGVVRPDSTLEVTIDSGSGPVTSEYRLSTPPVFSSVLPIRVAMGGELQVGRTVRLPVFDPSTLGTRVVEMRVLEYDTLIVPDSASLDRQSMRWSPAHYDTIPVWKVAEVYGGASVESWVDADGRVIQASSPLGFSMEKTEYELALQERDDERAALARGQTASALDDDVILSTAVASNVDLGEATRYREIRFRLSGVDLAGFQLDGGRQTLRGDTLIIRRENLNTLDAGYELPYKSMDLRAELQPEPLIQSDDPRILRRAREITAARTRFSQDPRQVAGQLTRGVYGMLEKAVTLSVPSAVQVLEAGRGDCNEHTVLYVAMARALGLPARTAVGLVYVRGSFYYHAWPEVWLGEWVAVDPTFGDAPADAAHLRFVVGGLAQQVEIVRLIGRLRIDVLEAIPEGPAE